MKAIGFTEHGTAEVLRELTLPDPVAGSGEVRVRVRAAAVNPVDAIIRSGAFTGMVADESHPIVPGMDVAGLIEQIGPDQPEGFDLRLNDAVTGFVAPSGTHGGYSEYVVLPSLSVTRMPSAADFVAGAAFLSNALTAELTLEAFDLSAGSTLAVTGAAGAVGGYLVELAAARGLVVIADAAAEDRTLVEGFGATHVVRRGEPFVSDVLEVTSGVGVDALADAAILTDAVLPAIRDHGQVAFYLPTSAQPDRGITTFSSYVMRSATRHDAIQRLAEAVGQGRLSTRVSNIYPAIEAAAAHRRLEQGKLRGRLVLAF